jgi:hypothetical protein
MEEYDRYINVKSPSTGLYVRAGASLPDFANKNEWAFDGTWAALELPPDVVKDVAAQGHAIRNMG